MGRRIWPVVLVVALLQASLAGFSGDATSATGGAPPDQARGYYRTNDPADAVKMDTSPPLASMTPATDTRERHERPQRAVPSAPNAGTDPVVQSSASTAAPISSSSGFEGISDGVAGFNVNSAPPDTNAAVGTTYTVQIVNSALAVFNKSTGAVVWGPNPTNTVFSGFGGGCQTNNDGDGVVKYDRGADRWVVSQFSVSTTPYLQCVAVSTSNDPTGTWYRYSFSYSDFPDYGKLAVWPDAFYATFNMFKGGVTFSGGQVCAYDRAKMLAGQAATQQCYRLSSYASLLPVDDDGGATLGTPGLVVNMGSSAINLWKFHVDFGSSANTTLTGPAAVAVASFTEACGGGTCVTQPGTSQKLDSLADRLMYRVAYRKFADHDSIVVNHSVAASSASGVRWYEIRNPAGSTPVVYQQGTYAPDSTYRWMGSVAMDKVGNVAVGYSASSSSTYPALRAAAWSVGEPLGTLSSETTLKAGGGSQLPNLSRWGDYSSMVVDPVDDCTFWFTSEYLASSGTFNWHTWISHFSLPSCTGSTASTVPSAPTLSGTAGDTVTHLSWTVPSDGGSPINGYQLDRGVGGTTTTISLTSGTTSYDDTSVTNGTTYTYVVRALNANGSSANSNAVSLTPTGSTPAALAASFTYSCGGTSTCAFSGSATGGTPPYTWSWRFSDGSTATSQNTSRTFGAGTWNVTLTVYDSATPTPAQSSSTQQISCARKGKKVVCR